MHQLSLGVLNSYGDTAFLYLSGAEALIFLEGVSVEFLNSKKRVITVRYDIDLNNINEGLRFVARYSKGTNIDLPDFGGLGLTEDKLTFDLQYMVLKKVKCLEGLTTGTRYAIYDNNFDSNSALKPYEELRISINYTWKF